ncbi:response regulator [Leifsonia naganoensis]|uniref:LmbE family N-acetylglucosaminyl deacetylase n=1 Tax=Leifsonia naganoensis TaxID=150025 RepID=A0A853DGI1_9MICO|nr:response regulator [Leifsonia naganoensis]NYK08192.1 LmbE family N-acetylglucosaminyl deacetylase [Leifsonia naganoensis]
MASSTQKYRVVVIEDDPDVAFFMKTVLEKRADAVVTAITDPSRALAAIADFEPDLVLTDIEMPGISGLDLLKELRSQYPGMPVVVMTAHVSVDYAVAALRSQADEFLTKPVASAVLVSIVTRLAEEGRTKRSASRQQVVLAVGAHPDDVEIGVGGILAAHRDAGNQVVILTLSRGARGGDANDRQHESLAAAELLGARLFLEDLEDTHISAADPTVSIIERVVREVEPDIVYTHSAHDRHQDHRAVNAAVSVATRNVRTVCCFQSPSATIDFRPTRFVPIDGFTDAKLALIDCFRSQDLRAYLEHDFVLATARYWSRFGGGTMCEPLEVMRDTADISIPASTISTEARLRRTAE